MNYFLSSQINTKTDVCLISFDDGPDPILTPKVLEILKKENVKAIFFLIGKKAEDHPEIVRKIVSEGHLIGNHSYSHNHFMSLFSKKRLLQEINAAQNSLKNVAGINPIFFRPPIGYTNPNYAKVLKQLNLHCIGWSVRSYDSVLKNSNKLIKRLLKKVRPGSIILLHDNLPQSVEALELFISNAKKNGIKFASTESIKELLHG